jgi:hypothetical protein
MHKLTAEFQESIMKESIHRRALDDRLRIEELERRDVPSAVGLAAPLAGTEVPLVDEAALAPAALVSIVPASPGLQSAPASTGGLVVDNVAPGLGSVVPLTGALVQLASSARGALTAVSAQPNSGLVSGFETLTGRISSVLTESVSRVVDAVRSVAASAADQPALGLAPGLRGVETSSVDDVEAAQVVESVIGTVHSAVQPIASTLNKAAAAAGGLMAPGGTANNAADTSTGAVNSLVNRAGVVAEGVSLPTPIGVASVSVPSVLSSAARVLAGVDGTVAGALPPVVLSGPSNLVSPTRQAPPAAIEFMPETPGDPRMPLEEEIGALGAEGVLVAPEAVGRLLQQASASSSGSDDLLDSDFALSAVPELLSGLAAAPAPDLPALGEAVRRLLAHANDLGDAGHILAGMGWYPWFVSAVLAMAAVEIRRRHGQCTRREQMAGGADDSTYSWLPGLTGLGH